MFTLGNQLAALSSKSSSVHSTSSVNNDGIGQGFHYSNKHGHALTTGGGGGNRGGVMRRASVLYGNARETAEVPVVILIFAMAVDFINGMHVNKIAEVQGLRRWRLL